MRSPEPNGGQRGSQNGMPQGGMQNHSYYGHPLTGQVPQNYYAPAMAPHDYGAGQHANQYYQPHPQVQVRPMPPYSYVSHPRERNPYYQSVPAQELTTPEQTGQHPGYGPVTYYNAPAPQATYDFETRKRGYDALDQFFGQVKRREFDPINYASVSRRLFELQNLQLPQIIPSNMGIPAYQPVAVGHGGYQEADPIQSYSLPPMGNAKTRGDLTSIDQILEQMQATIYENDTHLAQTGNGSGYVAYRTGSNSPPSQMPTSTPSSMLQHQHHGSIASTADSASTPGLTPPSSAQSYTSGQSPLQAHSAPSGNAMYPNLSNASDMAYAAANAATLSGMYDGVDSRRYSGDRLQRAKPSTREDDMDMGSDGSVTPPASVMNKAAKKGKGRVSPKDSVIDPTLDASTPKSEGKEEDREQVWVQNMRLIEWMRDLIKKKLERGDYDEDGKKRADKEDTDMGGTEDKEAKDDHEQLYPVLRHVEETA